MSSIETPVIERRRSTRKADRIRALVGPRLAAPEDCENGVIEELGKNGLRLLSGTPLKRDEPFRIYVNGDPRPLNAQVVWVRRQGLIEKRANGKAGQAFVAGCRVLQPAPGERSRGAFRRAEERRLADVQTRVIRGLIVVGGLGLLGLIAYIVATLAALVG